MSTPEPLDPEDRTGADASPSADGPPAAAEGGGVADPLDAELLGLSVESLLDDVERLTAERDKANDDRLRDRAEYENTRKRQLRQHEDQLDQAAARIVEDLLPVLDACDGAMLHGATEVEPIFAALLGALEKGGLEQIDPLGEPFDPTRHDAVMHEPADDEDTTVVADVLRRGYAWKGRVLRPAMVKVRG